MDRVATVLLSAAMCSASASAVAMPDARPPEQALKVQSKRLKNGIRWVAVSMPQATHVQIAAVSAGPSTAARRYLFWSLAWGLDQKVSTARTDGVQVQFTDSSAIVRMDAPLGEAQAATAQLVEAWENRGKPKGLSAHSWEKIKGTLATYAPIVAQYSGSPMDRLAAALDGVGQRSAVVPVGPSDFAALSRSEFVEAGVTAYSREGYYSGFKGWVPFSQLSGWAKPQSLGEPRSVCPTELVVVGPGDFDALQARWGSAACWSPAVPKPGSYGVGVSGGCNDDAFIDTADGTAGLPIGTAGGFWSYGTGTANRRFGQATAELATLLVEQRVRALPGYEGVVRISWQVPYESPRWALGGNVVVDHMARWLKGIDAEVYRTGEAPPDDIEVNRVRSQWLESERGQLKLARGVMTRVLGAIDTKVQDPFEHARQMSRVTGEQVRAYIAELYKRTPHETSACTPASTGAGYIAFAPRTALTAQPELREMFKSALSR